MVCVCVCECVTCVCVCGCASVCLFNVQKISRRWTLSQLGALKKRKGNDDRLQFQLGSGAEECAGFAGLSGSWLITFAVRPAKTHGNDCWW